MLALLQSVPVLASVLIAKNIVFIDPACRKAVFLDYAVPLAAEARGQQLLIKIEGF